MAQSDFGRISVDEDFNGGITVEGTTEATKFGELSQYAVGTAVLSKTVDEPGGVLAMTTGATDDDNVVLFTGPFKPADGGCWMEARIKMDALTTIAVYVGFSETLASTPVMPAEYATATMDYVATGSLVGMSFDSDGTAPDLWRAVAAETNVTSGDADTNGTADTTAPVADEWDIIRVEIDSDGRGRVYRDEVLIKDVGVFCTPTDVQHALVMVETRTGAASAIEIDYFRAHGYRDWTK